MPRPDLSHRSALVQRCILTAISDVRLVDTDYDVLTATVGSITATHKCSISVTANGAAGLDLVLAQKADLDYGQIGACINARIAELDCLSGRPSKLLRRASVTIKARVRVFVGELAAASEIHANGGTSSSIIDRALNHISAVDKMLGVRDMRLVSLEQRVNLLLLLGLEQPPPYCLDETMCGGSGEGGGSSGGASICPIEEIGEKDLEDPCCATGCEPCVWETYYANQAKERYVRLKAEAAPHGDVRKRQRRMDTVTDIVTDDKSKGGAIRDSSGGDGDEVGASEAQPASASEAEASERRATKIGLSVHLASIFTRESNAPPRPKPADPCAPHGGRSRVLCGRPDLDTLLYGISEEEIASAVLVICGPDEFNDSMRAAALEGTGRYPPARVFVRDTPPPPAADR